MNLPFSDSASGSESYPRAGLSSGGGRVLLIEDDPVIQGLIEMSLQKAGYEVKCAGDGEEGWSYLSEEHFDVLITDNNLPRLTGLALIRRLRTTDHRLPILLISGQIPWQAPGLDMLLTPGIALEKPFSMARLTESVRNVMHSAAA
jgi:two-component system cell cycle sensor histidine kinase/response regulator CckA